MANRHKTQVIIAAAGDGVRLKAPCAKAFAELCGKPLLFYSLNVFEQCPLIDSVILVAHPQGLSIAEQIIQNFHFEKVRQVVAGGQTRVDSVRKGLLVLDADTRFVAIHDAARPLISAGIVEEALRVCYDEKAVIVAVPVKSTIKRVDPKARTVVDTIDRENLWEIQTPQVFSRELIEEAHNHAASHNATDDAMLVEEIGAPVRIVDGDYRNIKVTTPEDLLIAEMYIKKSLGDKND